MILRATSLLLTSLALLSACGGGSVAAAPAPAPAPAASPATPSPAKLITLNGSPTSPGLHWIIIGDGFTAAQQADLQGAALDLVAPMLSAPEIASHTGVWNVHLLAAESRQSGVDDAAAGRFVDTPFAGALGCGSNSRVACVDWDKIHATLLEQGAPTAQLTVVLNTTEYVGSSNTSGIIVSRNTRAPRITFHEMGHRVAGLADEYVDAAVASEWLPYYFEGRFPNVTTVTDASLVPWRHWLADGASGVGLYEGAFYVSNGYYRPKQDSFMRTLDAPMGEVNAEAWLRAQFRSLPPLSSTSPETAQIRGLAGDTIDLAVSSAWPRTAVSLHWFVDGAEVLAARDSPTFRFEADGGSHDVEVLARDLSGRIRAPDAMEAQGRRGWQISPSGAPAPQKAGSVEADSLLWLRLRVDAAGHTIMGQHVGTRAGAPLPSRNEADWRYTVLDGSGRAVASGDIVDPRVVRSAMTEQGHATATLESGDYLLAVPRSAATGKLRISATSAGAAKLSWAGTVPSGTIELDLAAR
jgi:hypothetical protein